MKKRPFSELYIHVPFCAGKCDYCAFYSEPCLDPDAAKAWLSKLRGDMEQYAGNCTELQTVYLGGGTPTLLPPELMKNLFSLIRGNFSLARDAEISMECNPESLTEEKADVMFSFVNRVSMGIQSFSGELRNRIGRKGSIASAERAVTLLRERGLKNLGFDLICLLPGQTLEEWREELQKAVSLQPEHISCYSLTLEEGTPLAEKGIEQDESLSADMWEFAGEYLKEQGLCRYEISNYAKEGSACRHNFRIWHGAAYLGLGPSACSFDGDSRWMEASPLPAWLQGKTAEKDEIPDPRRLAELFIMGLRCVRGWRKEEWEEVSPVPWQDLWRKIIEKNQESGLLSCGEERIFPTQKGLEFWNDLAESFL